MVCPASISVTVLEGVEGSYVTFDPPTVTDNSGATNFVSSTASSGDYFQVGTTVVTFTYADSSGNEASCSFVVNVLTGRFAFHHTHCPQTNYNWTFSINNF